MVNDDTIQLLKECNSGIKMGISSIEDVLPMVKSEDLKSKLEKSKIRHESLEQETKNILNDYDDAGKEPNVFAKAGSWLKTNMKMAMNPDDATISDLMTDGCNMGIKSLNRYLNQYEAAEEKVKDITKKLINLEQDLLVDVRDYL